METEEEKLAGTLELEGEIIAQSRALVGCVYEFRGDNPFAACAEHIDALSRLLAEHQQRLCQHIWGRSCVLCGAFGASEGED